MSTNKAKETKELKELLETKRKERDQAISDFVAQAMKQYNGRLFLRSLLETSGLLASSSGMSPDANTLFFKEGMREVGLGIVRVINVQNKNNYSILLQGDNE